MRGIKDLPSLLRALNPRLHAEELVMITRPAASYGDAADLNPIACFREQEGLTLIVPKTRADAAGEDYEGVFRQITLEVHSHLEAVGLTAAVASALAQHGISANMLAAFYHDHVLVPAPRAEEAEEVLRDLMTQPPEAGT